MERYEPTISLPESANMRDIPKWRSQKSVWVPFIITLDMSVWETLKTVLDKDSSKELHFQLAPTTELDEHPTGTEQKSSANAEETGSFFMTGFSSMFTIAFNYISLFSSFLESEEGGSDSSSAEEESSESSLRSRGYITGQLFLNLHHCHPLVQDLLLSRLLTFYTSKKQFTADADFFYPFCVSYFPLTFCVATSEP